MDSWIIGIVCILLLCIVIYEAYKNQKKQSEAFTNYFDTYYPKRTDILPEQTREDNDWIRDIRYKEQYVDVQKIGVKHDLCRVVLKRDDPGTMMMACALAGTDGLPSRTYATLTKANGFVFSRDDYFRENSTSGRADYCRIIKSAPDTFESYCATGDIGMFSKKEVRDNSPPEDIITLLWFYEGIMIWYRFKDDLLDYAQNTTLGLLGNIKINQNPVPKTTEGLKINSASLSIPAEQFIRIGENEELEFDQKVELSNLRAFMFWVKFDAFTNNAHIFDFGNGAGHNNVYFGIEGTGNDPNIAKQRHANQVVNASNIVCQSIAPREVDPRIFMKYTDANVELYDCPGPQPIARATELNEPYDSNSYIGQTQETPKPKTANLLFEIWDAQQRKMRIKCVDAIKERTLHHIAVTVSDLSFRPSWKVYVDNKLIYTEIEGHLPQTNYTTKNYIGRSNWENTSETYSDERFRGTLFDFRMYKTPISEEKIAKSMMWGKKQLIIPQES